MFVFLQFVKVICVWSDSSVRVVPSRASVGLISVCLRTTRIFFSRLYLCYVGGRVVWSGTFSCLERLMRRCRCTSCVR